MAVQIQLRRDTAVNWAAANPVLAQGEIALDLDELGTANRFKIGNGTDHWSDLLYFTVIDYIETDPVFMAWDKSTGIVITVSQISDFPDIPDSTSDLVNDSGFITLEDVPEETDPLFSAWDKSTGISISKSQITDYTEPVQSDWNQTVNTELDYIKNKPSIPSDLSELTDTTGIIPDKVSELENDSGFITIGDVPAETDPVFMAWDKDYNDLINKPTIPAAQVNSDWNATGGVAEILNKPTIPAAQIQSDWTQTNNTLADYIKNKPDIPDPDDHLVLASSWDTTPGTLLDKIYPQNDSIVIGTSDEEIPGETVLTIAASGSTVIENVTLGKTGWILVTDYYEYEYSNVAIKSNSIVQVIPANSTIDIVTDAQILPYIQVETEMLTLYSKNAPTDDIVVNIVVGR